MSKGSRAFVIREEHGDCRVGKAAGDKMIDRRFGRLNRFVNAKHGNVFVSHLKLPIGGRLKEPATG
jgi:hypothetical protein